MPKKRLHNHGAGVHPQPLHGWCIVFQVTLSVLRTIRLSHVVEVDDATTTEEARDRVNAMTMDGAITIDDFDEEYIDDGDGIAIDDVEEVPDEA
jgi:hypothetical protein